MSPISCLSRAALPLVYPAFLEQAAQALGARHRPDADAVRLNVDADATRVLEYLGTYFPRTVVEFRTIAGELLVHPAARAAVAGRGRLRVLDLGSGSGGAWIGLALALADARVPVAMEVTAIDGNAAALALQGALAPAVARATGLDIDVMTLAHTLRSDRVGFSEDLKACLEAVSPGEEGFDVIIASKHFSEHYHAAHGAARGVVEAGLALLSRRLAETGLLFVLDLTCRIDGGSYFAFDLADEVRRAVAGDAGLRTILPLPCAAASSVCDARSGCFTQRRLPVVRGGAGCCVTKVTYRILSRPDLARRFLDGIPLDRPWAVNAARPMEACRMGRKIVALDAPSGFFHQTATRTSA